MPCEMMGSRRQVHSQLIQQIFAENQKQRSMCFMYQEPQFFVNVAMCASRAIRHLCSAFCERSKAKTELSCASLSMYFCSLDLLPADSVCSCGTSHDVGLNVTKLAAHGTSPCSRQSSCTTDASDTVCLGVRCTGGSNAQPTTHNQQRTSIAILKQWHTTNNAQPELAIQNDKCCGTFPLTHMLSLAIGAGLESGA